MQISNHIFAEYSVSLTFLLITNNEINAKFLARYIAKKLTYHHKLKHILNPLKREFKKILRGSSLFYYRQKKLEAKNNSYSFYHSIQKKFDVDC